MEHLWTTRRVVNKSEYTTKNFRNFFDISVRSILNQKACAGGVWSLQYRYLLRSGFDPRGRQENERSSEYACLLMLFIFELYYAFRFPVGDNLALACNPRTAHKNWDWKKNRLDLTIDSGITPHTRLDKCLMLSIVKARRNFSWK